MIRGTIFQSSLFRILFSSSIDHSGSSMPPEYFEVGVLFPGSAFSSSETAGFSLNGMVWANEGFAGSHWMAVGRTG